MPKTFDEVILEMIEQYGLMPASCDQPEVCCGRCMKPSETVGRGRIWIYKDSEHLGMILLDVKLNKGVSADHFEDYRILSYYEKITGTVRNNGIRNEMQPNTLYTNFEPYEQAAVRLQPHKPIKGLWILADKDQGLKDLADGIFQDVDFGKAMGLRFVPQVLTIMAQIEKCPIKNTATMSSLYYHSKLQELLSLYAGAMERNGTQAEEIHTDDRERIVMLQQYIQNHLDENANLDDLAKMAHMSKSKLKYSFKAVSGSTVGQYRDDLRVRKACTMLQNTGSSISAIGKELGFSSSSSFSRFFRSQMDMTPHQYRDNNFRK